MPYGRADDEWNDLVRACTDWLVEVARRERSTSYTETNTVLEQRTGHEPFDFGREGDRTAMGALLGEVTQRTIGDSGAMLSALVFYLNANDAGPGFYKLAVELGLLAPNPSREEKDAFWAAQVGAIHAHYR